MTIIDVISRSAEFLDKKGVESPRLNAELVTAHALKLPRMQLYLNFDRPVEPAVLDYIRSLIIRRGSREPLQHILGTTHFCGLEFHVDKRALIPRPETELLVELALALLEREEGRRQRIIDFGTGSGCIAITLAHKRPDLHVDALDISAAALELAMRNAEEHGVVDRIAFTRSDGFDRLAVDPKYAMVVANPPYIPTPELAMLAPEIRDFDPRQALDGGIDGLDFYRFLARSTSAFLRPGARILMELGEGQTESVTEIFQQQHWVVESTHNDYTERLRFLVAHSRA